MVRAEEATPEVPKLLVTDLVTEGGIDKGLINLLNELLLGEFNRAGTHDVMGGSDVRAMLEAEIRKQQLDCGEVCLSEIGGMLGAQYLAAANIGVIGEVFLFNLKIIDVSSARLSGRCTRQALGKEHILINAVRECVAEVTGTELPLDDITVDDGLGNLGWAAVAGGVAAVGLGFGIGFGVAARDQLDISPVQPGFGDRRDTAGALATVSNFGWAVAVLGAGVAAFFVGLEGWSWFEGSGTVNAAPKAAASWVVQR